MRIRSLVFAIVLSLLTGCSTYQFTGPKNISIDPGCPAAYTKEEVTKIAVYTVEEWIKKYGKPKYYDSLQNLSVTIDDQPVNGEYYGIAESHGIPYIVVWAHTPYPNESAITHEMIHVMQGLATGDTDKTHSGSYWGDGFESPVKCGLAR